MLKNYKLLLLTCLCLPPLTSLAQSKLINNINGYTVSNGKLVEFKALQFNGDVIEKIYLENEHLPYSTNTSIVRIDGQGKTLLPGLIDAHGHVLSYGLSLMRAQLRGSVTEQQAVETVVAFRQLQPTMQWIQGRGWNQVLWPQQNFPVAASLDKVFPDTPVWLVRIDGHAGWANSAAMKIAGISSATTSPEGGEIIKYADGQPTGVFIDNAMSLITTKIPQPSIDEQQEILLTALTSLAKQGLTSVHDAGIGSDTIAAYQALDYADKLPIRVYAMIDAQDPEFDKMMQAGPMASGSDKLHISSVKISADGALGSRGAALIEDYSDLAGHKGLLLYSEKELGDTIQQAMDAGFQVNTHAIGDNANQIVLDHYQANIAASNSRHLRHRIEHAQVLQLADIPRFAQLNVIASMQATHATSDKNMALDRIGNARIKGAYAWRKLLNANTIIAAGSDFPIESPNPFYGLHASVTRQDHDNQPVDGWYRRESMNLTEALATFTTHAAFAAHQEQMIGQLVPKRKADFILIDKDIFAINPEDIWKTKVLETWVDGERVE
ncbi:MULTISPECIES: amidohydrolase [unclassified Shewanella]|uniref:amidohydrolase n=1 Tax=unclassified Shewanella TaxID=196818 RepID=UPI000C8227E4|nr:MULTISPECIES: amidohydrolase [unclassified Shewanella]MDO6619833.1 amidohydrolase [Shewanella sp. 6_MG-2023]MDO6676953.1 amidohydrolase [Shewanella sp. 4_MG-2023]MDO6774001.1 amidohydrolase [Shewanella sp. 3_MG-2023]PMG40182.1 amidohydrolase [Shewanella sp. 10N.286.52.B9]PMH95205.1 amidohydrolase [Shewanella sp. 10N.286.48.A6]